MQIVISKTLFVRMSSFEQKVSLISQLLTSKVAKNLEIKNESWDDIVAKLAKEPGGMKKTDGATVCISKAGTPHDEDCLVIDVADALIIEITDAYEDFAVEVIPMVIGFMSGLKALTRVFDSRMKAISTRWNPVKAKAAKKGPVEVPAKKAMAATSSKS